MMNIMECFEAYQKIEGWKVIADFSVGGFEWLGFSKKMPNKLICISSQKTTLVDCENGKIESCDAVYDEEELLAICEQLPDEQIAIAGQYGAYICGFSYDGNYFVLANDGGVTILKRYE